MRGSILWTVSRTKGCGMNDQSGISVIIPFYNGGRHFRDALHSVTVQTVPADDVVIINDGSDAVHSAMLAEIVAEYSSRLNISLLEHANRGQSDSRNIGVAAAAGAFLAFLDQDDGWMPQHLELLRAPFDDDDELGWAYSDFDEIDGEGLLVTRNFIRHTGRVHPKSSLIGMLGEDLMILPTASMLRRSAFDSTGGFDPRLRGYEDDDLFIRMFRRGWSSAFIPQSLAKYRVHSTGSSAFKTFRASRMIFFDKLRNSFPDDHRLNRRYLSDLVVPRLLASTVSEYSVAIEARRYPEAREIAESISVLLAGRTHIRWYSRVGVALLRHPRIARVALRIRRTLPLFLRPGISPHLRLES